MAEKDRPHYTAPTGKLWRMLKPLARQKRHEPTDAENALWQQLRNRQIAGLKFRRQHAIERFIVDFCCSDARLVIEVDGAIHDYAQEEDAIRQTYLESLGLDVVRFSNEQVLNDMPAVIRTIRDRANAPSNTHTNDPASSSPARGEGAGG